MAGIGLEFGAVVSVFTFGGYWVDQRVQTEPWCLLGGFFFALIGMTYIIIKRALQIRFNDPE